MEQRRLEDPKFGWKYPVITQPKLDGERCRALEEFPGTVNLISSELNDFMGIPHINQALEEIKQKYPELPELDGELYQHGLDFSGIHSIVSRSLDNLHPKYDLMQYHIFDLISDDPQIKRTIDLTNIAHDYIPAFSPIQIVPHKIAYNFEDIMEQYHQYLNDGFEGIIVRHIEAPYYRKRSRFILKFKPKKQDIYKIVGVVEAISKDGYRKGMVGSLVCIGNDGTKFNVGAGELTHQQRRDYWKIRDELPGRECLVGYQNIISGSRKPRFGLCIEILK